MATILVVDDHPSNRQLLVTLLSYKGHRVVEAADGAEGLVAARTERPDLVISDILMPTMDGYEFVRLLRADPALAQTPVVFWSVTYLEHEARTLASACGVSHILVKPCDPQEVIRTVDAVLGHAPTPAVVLPPEEFGHEHVCVVTDKLSQKIDEITTTKLKLDALIETGQRLALERDPPQLLHDYCRAARDIIGARWVAIGMLDEDGHTYHHCVTTGLAPELTATISPPQFHQGIFREVFHARGALRLHGLPGDPQAAGLSPGYPPVYSFLGVAIFSPMRVYGGICFANKLGNDAFSEDDERLATTLAAQLAVAYENAQLYKELERRATLLEQEVAERQRAEEALRASEAHYRLLFDRNPHPMWVYDQDTLTILAVNSARAHEYLTTVQQAAKDVAHTVARLREFYRQPVSQQEALPVDLNQIIPQVVELTRARWRDEPQRLGITIAVHTTLQEEGLPPILDLESELREALINLIFNAVDAMPQGGDLILRTQATPTAVIVEVSDTGIGMDEATRQRCLEPFYTTKEARGTGLGLAMVYGIVERHAAQLVIESAVGQGTTVRLLFPVALSQDEMAVPLAEVEASLRPLRLLVVDDDLIIRRLLQDVLQDEGHRVTVVEGGRVGLEALQDAQERQEPFDVVITDLGMPEMDGREVARGVKHTAPDTPVILLTGWGQALQQEVSLPPHVDHLLSKPPGLRELRAALRTVTRLAGRKDNHGHN